MFTKTKSLFFLTLIALALQGAHAAESSDRLIVRFKGKTQTAALPNQANQQVQTLSAKTGIALQAVRTLGTGAQLLRLTSAQSGAELEKTLHTLRQDSSIAYVEIDQKRQANGLTNDPFYKQFYTQDTATDPLVAYSWGLDAPSSDVFSMNILRAWDTQIGSANTTIAIIDTGIVPHEDLAPSRILAGYDFATGDTACTGDGDERDNNPADPGDWIDAAAISAECGVDLSDSSWHGTFVAGILAATANNNLGLAGVNWKANILPIRVLSKGGGYDSDIIDAALWAAGFPISGVPNNTHPAQVLNLSLGGSNPSCPSSYQEAINRITGAGKNIVVAAGNSAGSSLNQSPANCQGVIAVAASSRAGYLTNYTDSGSNITISATGGGTKYKVYSTSNASLTSPSPNLNAYANEVGTSFSAPFVSGVISLMLGANPNLSPAEVKMILQQSATAFPVDSDCNNVCGAGVVNAQAAVIMAQRFGERFSPLTASYTLNAQAEQSANQVVVFTNSSSITLSIGNMVLSGTGRTAYSLTADSCSNQNISAGASCSVTVVFSPSSVGDYPALLTMNNNSATGANTITLNGIASAAPNNNAGGGGCVSNSNRGFDFGLLVLLALAGLGLLRRVFVRRIAKA